MGKWWHLTTLMPSAFSVQTILCVMSVEYFISLELSALPQTWELDHFEAEEADEIQ